MGIIRKNPTCFHQLGPHVILEVSGGGKIILSRGVQEYTLTPYKIPGVKGPITLKPSALYKLAQYVIEKEDGIKIKA